MPGELGARTFDVMRDVLRQKKRTSEQPAGEIIEHDQRAAE
jgi:hypothetical protein